jgi:hypothetical protein
MIRTFLIALALLALAGRAPLAQGAQAPVDMSGQWDVTYSPPAGDVQFMMNLRQNGSRLTGTMITEGGEFPITGTVDGKAFTMTFTRPSGGQMVKFVLKGTVDGEMATGTAKLNDDPEAPLSCERTSK